MGTTLLPWITALTGPALTLILLGIWRYRDKTESRIDELEKKLETKISALDTKFETKFDGLNKLLTDNLIALHREMGETKGASHTHTQG